jgi:hypothetical protein
MNRLGDLADRRFLPGVVLHDAELFIGNGSRAFQHAVSACRHAVGPLTQVNEAAVADG